MKAKSTNALKIEPDILLTQSAWEQIELIKENDYTVEDKILRLHIDGKGCDGFKYAIGFDMPKENDVVLSFEQGNQSLEIHLTPFCYFFCYSGIIDYLSDVEIEGFLFTNKNEDNYHRKFFKDENMTPPVDWNPYLA